MKIRKYTTSDKSNIMALWKQVFPDNPKHSQPLAVLEAKLAVDDLIFVVEYQGEFSGACIAGYDGHRGWLYAVAVSEKHRRLGIGKALIEHTILELKRIGCFKVNLQIRDTNHNLVHFYESLGFEVEPRVSMGKKLV